MPVAPLIGLAGSIGGALLGRQGPKTSTSTSSSRPYFTDTQMGLQGPVAKLLKQLMKGKETRLDRELRTQTGEGINDQYQAQGSRLDSMLTQRGFGESGKHNYNTLGLELSRNKDFAQAMTRLAQDRSARQLTAVGLAGKLSFDQSGSDMTGTGTLPGQSMGNSLAPVVAGTGQDLATWLYSRQNNGGGQASPWGLRPS